MTLTRRRSHANILIVMVATLAACGLVAVSSQPAEATFQDKNGKIAFSSDRTEGEGVDNPTGDAELFTVNPDGSDLTQLTFNENADDYAPDYTSDGEEIAFTSDRDGASAGEDDIFVMNADGSDQENVTETPKEDDSFPSWSPRNRWIAFTSDRDGNFEIYRIKESGRAKKNLTRNPADDSIPSWSPRGSKIAFQSDRDGDVDGDFATFDIFEVGAFGFRAKNLTDSPEFNDLLPDYSPNGRSISFASDEEGAFPFVLDIFKMRSDGSNRQRLTDTPYAVEFFSAWSPDGRYIAFDSTRDEEFVSEDDVNEDIFTMKSDGTDETKISGVPGADDYGPSWQPTGKGGYDEGDDGDGDDGGDDDDGGADDS